LEIHELQPELMKLVDHAKKLKRGLDIFRNIEFPITIKLLCPKKDERILDIGCGESILPSYISKNYECIITATDILDVEKIQRKFFKTTNLMGLGNREFKFKINDATNLSFTDETFDSVYAVSSIEHIPNDGDSRAFKEMVRVVKPGGKIVVTVPYSYKYLEQKTADHYQGFERRYDYENLKKRLLDFYKGDEIELYFLNNKFPWLDEFCNIWYQEKLYEVVNEFSWRFTKTFFTLSEKPNESSRGAMFKVIKS